MKKLFCYLFALSATIWGQSRQFLPSLIQIPTRQFGHPLTENLANLPTQASPNLVDGRELDASGADRVRYQRLILRSFIWPISAITGFWRLRIRRAYSGKTADLVLGQQDFVSTMAQGPATRVQHRPEFADRARGG